MKLSESAENSLSLDRSETCNQWRDQVFKGTLQPSSSVQNSAVGIAESLVSRIEQKNLSSLLTKTALSHLSDSDRIKFINYGFAEKQRANFDNVYDAIAVNFSRTPHATAAEFEGSSLSYAELDRYSLKLSIYLRQKGIGSQDCVGLFLRRSLAMIVGIVAILRTGATYVPQQAGIAPEQQLKHVVKTAEIKLVLSSVQGANLLPEFENTEVKCIEHILKKNGAGINDLDRDLDLEPKQRERSKNCFILFTSGTTGKPNGVVVTHKNVSNIILSAPGNLGIEPGDRVAHLLNIAFDMAAWEILTCLAYGATLLIRNQDFQATASKANVIIATPSILAKLDPNKCENIHTVAVAGEPCSLSLANRWASKCRFYNCCGPTETTIVNTMHEHKPNSKGLTIGKPTPNNTVYVLNEKRQPCAIGEVGEMWAGGACVTEGYLKNDTLTADRYLPDPFLGGTHRMFRTRDLGRWTPDGELEHLGRTDDQVKIRGFRVELDSVANIIELASGCQKAVAMKYDNRHLIAFAYPSDSDLNEAKILIQEQLPYYCLPLDIIPLEKLPLTSRGKVDKQRLQDIIEAYRDQLSAYIQNTDHVLGNNATGILSSKPFANIFGEVSETWEVSTPC